jgi:class 3 adenylate cyclase
MTFRSLAHGGQPQRESAVFFADLHEDQFVLQDESIATAIRSELRRETRDNCAARSGRSIERADGGVFAVFDSIDDALQAAVAVRDAFLNCPAVVAAGASVRIGAHVGELKLTANGELYGDAPSVAAALCALAPPGHILVTDVARSLLQQSTVFTLEYLGQRNIEGMASPLQVYAITRGDSSAGNGLKKLLQDELAPLQLLDQAAAGGMGEIYLARDARLRRTLAVKVLKPDLAQGEGAARFLQEARIIAAISHPNVVNIHSVGELADGTPYYVMDYVAGGSLADRLSDLGPVSVREARRMVGEVASALQAAHARGVVHRDVKPSNVLYDSDSGRLRLTDWGIARVDADDADLARTSRTQVGQLVGSPAYMSPEQIRNDVVGPPADVYALGILAFELVMGKRPFSATSAASLMAAHLSKEPPTLAQTRRDVDPEFSEIVSRCLAKDPAARPTAHEVALRLGGPSNAVMEWPPPGLDRLVGRGSPALFRVAAWVGVSVLLVTSLMQYTPANSDATTLFLTGSTACLASLVLAALAALRLIPVVSAVAAARRAGFDWETVIDVLADTRGDTGSLLAGTRDYGGLSIRNRRRLALFRRSSVLLPALTAGLGVMLLIATAVSGPILGALALFGIGVLFALGNYTPRIVEHFLVGTRWAAAAKERAATPGLTEAWYRSLEILFAKRTTQRTSTLPLVASLVVLLAALAGIGSVAVPGLVVGTAGAFADALMLQALAETQIDVRQMQRLHPWRELALPAEDSSDGGLILEGALAAFQVNPQAGELDPQFPSWRGPTDWQGLLRPLGVWDSLPEGWTANPTDSRGAGEGSLIIDADFVVLRHNRAIRDSLLAIASRGLTPEQESWIQSLTSHPSVAAFGAVARMATLHLNEALWDSVTLLAAPLGALFSDSGVGLDLLEELKYLEAAGHVSRGRWREADVSLREALTVAFKLSDSDYVFGRPRMESIVESLDRIASLHELQGDTEGVGQRIRSTLAGMNVDDQRSSATRARHDASAFASELLSDSLIPPAQQIALARAMGLSSRCGSLVEVARGPRSAEAVQLEALRGRLVDTPQERAYWSRFVEREPDDASVLAALRDHGLAIPLAARVVPGWLASASKALGNPRIGGCRWYVALAELYTF